MSTTVKYRIQIVMYEVHDPGTQHESQDMLFLESLPQTREDFSDYNEARTAFSVLSGVDIRHIPGIDTPEPGTVEYVAYQKYEGAKAKVLQDFENYFRTACMEENDNVLSGTTPEDRAKDFYLFQNLVMTS